MFIVYIYIYIYYLSSIQPAVVQKIFEAYLEMFLSVKADTIKQPSFDAMMLDYPEIHEDSFPKLVMMAAM